MIVSFIWYGLRNIEKKVLVGLVAERVRELLRQICKSHEVDIIKGHVSKDHVHLFVSVPPSISTSSLMQQLKGKSSYKLLQENKQLQKEFWGRHLWGRGYFVATSGNITDEVIMEYIENQDLEKDDEDFKISES